jgi:hypothetical protein
MKSAVFLLVLMSVAACGRPQNSAVAPAAGSPLSDGSASSAVAPSSPPIAGATPASEATSDFTTPEQAAAIAGTNNQNMQAAENYLAAHPAARARRHTICDRIGTPTAMMPRVPGLYCKELQDADVAAPLPGVKDTEHF